MKERKIGLSLSIDFQTPFIIGSGFGLSGVLDLKTIKDSKGIVYITGSTIKGKIKAEFKKIMLSVNGSKICNSLINNNTEICKFSEIKDACVICQVFGSEFYESSLIFEDAVMDAQAHSFLSKIEQNKILPQSQSAIRSGVKLNRILRVAEPEALFTFETAYPLTTFISKIHGSAILTDEEYEILKSAIKGITHLGRNKAGGLGRCKINVEEVIS